MIIDIMRHQYFCSGEIKMARNIFQIFFMRVWRKKPSEEKTFSPKEIAKDLNGKKTAFQEPETIE